MGERTVRERLTLRVKIKSRLKWKIVSEKEKKSIERERHIHR